MPKRKREVTDSDDSVEASLKNVKNQLQENEEVLFKKKHKKHKQQSDETTNENLLKEVLPENEESLSLSPKKKKKKNKQLSADITDEKVMQTKDASSGNEESFAPSPKKKKKKNTEQKEPNLSSLKSGKEQETSPVKPTAHKKSSLSKGFVLFVGQIPHNIKQKDVEKHFATVGGIKEVRLLFYPDSQRPRGCAYVEFVDNQHRKKALELNGSTLGRAKIKVEYPYQGGKRYGGGKNKPKGKKWKPKKE